MVQCLPELHGVDQGMAVDIGLVMLGQVRTCKHKGCNLPVVHPDVSQITSHAKVKRSPEDIRGL